MSHSHGHGHGHTHGQGHSHAPADLADHRGRIALVLTITCAVLVAEVVGAILSGSLALLADAGHMLTDVVGLGVALGVAVLARRPPTLTRTWGFRRAEIIGAAAQATLLLAVGGFVLVEAVKRLMSPEPIAPNPVLVFGVVGLVGNVIGLLILAGAQDGNLNMRAAFLEVLNDALGSAAVIISAIVVFTTGWARADAVASLVIGLLIVPRTLRLLYQSIHVLLESTPAGVDVAAIRADLAAVDHVTDVHDLHVSQISTDLPILTAHLVLDETCFHDGHTTQILDNVQQVLRENHRITHTTIQLEPATHLDHEPGAHH